MNNPEVKDGDRIKTWSGLEEEFLTARHWDKSKPLISDNEGWQWLQVEDDQGNCYWLRSYPGWSVVKWVS